MFKWGQFAARRVASRLGQHVVPTIHGERTQSASVPPDETKPIVPWIGPQSRSGRVASTLLLGLLMAVVASEVVAGADGSTPRALDYETVARRPAPGTVVPGEFAFTSDGKAVTYLKSESSSLARVLWRAEMNGGPPRIIARPPGAGDTEASVSKEEALRRERLRLPPFFPPPSAAAATPAR